MQSKEELEKWWETKDAWGYETNPDDLFRKEQILSFLKTYKRALDIGAGEGWITKDLPAKEIYALEISDNASKRLPKNVTGIKEPEGKYQLILLTGVLYKQYNHVEMANIAKKHGCRHILVAGIDNWLIDYDFGKKIKETVFPYREYKQRVMLYEI